MIILALLCIFDDGLYILLNGLMLFRKHLVTSTLIKFCALVNDVIPDSKNNKN